MCVCVCVHSLHLYHVDTNCVNICRVQLTVPHLRHVCNRYCANSMPHFMCLAPVKVKVIPQQADVAQGVPGSLRPRIFLTFVTTTVVGRQPYAPAAFTPKEIPGTHFQRLSRPQGTWFRRWEPRKKFPVTPPGIDLGTVRLVAQCLNHYATPGPPSSSGHQNERGNSPIHHFVVHEIKYFCNIPRSIRNVQ